MFKKGTPYTFSYTISSNLNDFSRLQLPKYDRVVVGKYNMSVLF